MTSQQNSDRRIGEDRDDVANVAHEAEALFARLGDWGLGKLMELAREEMKKRLADAEKRIAEMKQHFGGVDVQAPKPEPTQGSQKTKRRNKQPPKLGSAGSAGPKNESRGKLKSTIFDILSNGQKSRSDIENEIKARGLPTKSVGTTLNRLKKGNKINHDTATRMYSRSEDHQTNLASDVDEN